MFIFAEIFHLKQLGSIVLLMLLVFPFAGTYCWLHYEKASLRKAVKKELLRGLDDGKLVRLEFTQFEIATLLNWHHAKEFEYRGQMYDIVRQSSASNTHIYWCFPDHAETRLNNQLSSLVNNLINQDKQRQQQQKETFDYYKSLFFQPVQTSNSSRVTLSLEYFIARTEKLSSYFTTPSVPPPRLT
ncbi:MAG: hypothetical protein CVT99_00665 [Bacteroidetes bacterium HGW-Bacteroidetes-16]|jgi:hypothetical protein|nr:MAG: hypothetical protein CVT99_00665 [Bacteroidetes bacterium HGW-Bacteroidetes-16]